MPNVPTFTNQVSAVTGGGIPRLDANQAGYTGAVIARAGQQLSGEMEEWNRRYAEARRQSEAADLLAESTSKLGDMEFRWGKLDDNMAAKAGFDQEATKLRDETLQRIQDPQIAALFSDQFTKEMISRSESTRKSAFGVESATQKGNLDLRISAYAKQAANASSPALRDQMLQRAQADIVSATAAGWLHGDEGAVKLLKFNSDISEADALRDITDRPELAQQQLLDPNFYPGLDPVARSRLSDRANTRVDALRADRIRMAELADRQSEKALKKKGDMVAKDLWGKQADGTLTRDDIEVAKTFLEPSEYRALVSASQNLGAANDDPATIARLEQQIGTSGFADEARNALEAHMITTDRFVSMLDKNRSELGQAQPSSPYKSGRSLVQTTLEPGQLLDGGAAALAHAGQAQALVEFDNWAAEHPDATRAQAIEEAQKTIARYQIVNYQQMSIATGLPRYYTGTRDALKTTDLDAAEARTVQDLDGNKISREQADQELRKIASWRYILAQKQAPAPATGGTK